MKDIWVLKIIKEVDDQEDDNEVFLEHNDTFFVEEFYSLSFFFCLIFGSMEITGPFIAKCCALRNYLV